MVNREHVKQEREIGVSDWSSGAMEELRHHRPGLEVQNEQAMRARGPGNNGNGFMAIGVSYLT
jgi:hypothetical protein